MTGREGEIIFIGCRTLQNYEMLAFINKTDHKQKCKYAFLQKLLDFDLRSFKIYTSLYFLSPYRPHMYAKTCPPPP